MEGKNQITSKILQEAIRRLLLPQLESDDFEEDREFILAIESEFFDDLENMWIEADDLFEIFGDTLLGGAAGDVEGTFWAKLNCQRGSVERTIPILRDIIDRLSIRLWEHKMTSDDWAKLPAFASTVESIQRREKGLVAAWNTEEHLRGLFPNCPADTALTFAGRIRNVKACQSEVADSIEELVSASNGPLKSPRKTLGILMRIHLSVFMLGCVVCSCMPFAMRLESPIDPDI